MSGVQKSSSSVALQSLTATYTDSEGEEEAQPKISENGDAHTQHQNGSETERKSDIVSLSASPASIRSGTNTPLSGGSANAGEIRRMAARLVSYNNDEAMSEDDNSEEEDSNSRVEFPMLRASRPVTPTDGRAEDVKLLPGEDLLPPEPTGKCPPDLQEKITRMYEKMVRDGLDINASIQNKKQFRNPSIYEKLIQFCEIDELGTNYPPEIYDPHRWGQESHYENLAKTQREEMEKREREKRDRTKVEFVSGTAAKKPGATKSDEDRPRKSKWDQGGPQPQVLTTAVTGTKTTVISAFGAIPKKPKL